MPLAAIILLYTAAFLVLLLVFALYRSLKDRASLREQLDEYAREHFHKLRAAREELRRARTSQRSHLAMFEQEAAKADELGTALRKLLVALGPLNRGTIFPAFRPLKAARDEAAELIWPTGDELALHNAGYKVLL